MCQKRTWYFDYSVSIIKWKLFLWIDNIVSEKWIIINSNSSDIACKENIKVIGHNLRRYFDINLQKKQYFSQIHCSTTFQYIFFFLSRSEYKTRIALFAIYLPHRNKNLFFSFLLYLRHLMLFFILTLESRPLFFPL